MNILIDNKSGTPIYDQIYSQIKGQIISGALKQDELLPSIRGLAKDLRISFITTKRAYEELEKEGFIYTLPAKGCYVAPKNVELLREENLKKIESLFQIFRKYRNKIVCHQTCSTVEAPCRKSIDKTISILEELLLMYSKLFWIHILATAPEPIYRNPPLHENNAK